MSVTAKRVDCEVVEWVKYGILRWFGYMIKMDDYFVKRMFMGSIEERGVKGRPPVKWINRVDEYWRKVVDWELKVLKRIPEQGKLEVFLLWSPPWGKFLCEDRASEI